MLADFQQALADLVASPERCRRVRDAAEHGALFDGYRLTEREAARLTAIARHRGMEANCTVYRSNRLTPLALNLPDTCAALGPHLRDVLDRFWADNPTEQFVHFLIESERFATFVERLLGELPGELAADVGRAVGREDATVRTRLAASLAT